MTMHGISVVLGMYDYSGILQLYLCQLLGMYAYSELGISCFFLPGVGMYAYKGTVLLFLLVRTAIALLGMYDYASRYIGEDLLVMATFSYFREVMSRRTPRQSVL